MVGCAARGEEVGDLLGREAGVVTAAGGVRGGGLECEESGWWGGGCGRSSRGKGGGGGGGGGGEGEEVLGYEVGLDAERVGVRC